MVGDCPEDVCVGYQCHNNMNDGELLDVVMLLEPAGRKACVRTCDLAEIALSIKD